MSASAALALATTAWGVVMAIGPVLQIRRIRSARSAAGVSTAHLVVLLVGFALWLAYGVVEGLAPLVVTNVVSLVATGAWLVVAWRYRAPA